MSDSDDEPLFERTVRNIRATQNAGGIFPDPDSDESDDEPLFARRGPCQNRIFNFGNLVKKGCEPRTMLVPETINSVTPPVAAFVPCVPVMVANDGLMDQETEPEVLNQDNIVVEYVKKDRKPSSRAPSTRETNLLEKKNCSPQAIQLVRGFFCHCRQPCANMFDVETIKKIRESYWKRSQPERTEFLVNKLVFDMNADLDKHVINFRYTVNGNKVCGSFFRNLFPVSKQHFADIRKRVCERRLVVTRKSNDSIHDKKRESALNFLDNYVRENGEPQPHKKEFNLPSGISKEDVYVEYLATFSDDMVRLKIPAQLSYWYEIWRTWRNQVKCPEWSTFSKCSTCTNIRIQLQLGDPTLKGKSC